MRYKRLRNEIRSPLRYPGGKSRAIKTILPHIPYCHEFREPFVGGGSVFIAVKQRWPRDAIFRINDKNYDLYCFWKQLQIRGQEFIQSVQEYKDAWTDGQQLYNHLVDSDQIWNDFDRGIRFFILNRITFSGTVEAGGYSSEAFRVRFTRSSITRLKRYQRFYKTLRSRMVITPNYFTMEMPSSFSWNPHITLPHAPNCMEKMGDFTPHLITSSLHNICETARLAG